MELLTTKDLIIVLLILGVFLALGARICAKVTFKNPKDREVLGVPTYLLGLSGYVMMLIAVNTDMVTFYSLLTITIVVTLLLMVKSMMLKRLCPFCAACWGVNLALLALSIKMNF
ncbi:MAG: hypothetical protein KBD52_02035 [Candidatus Pacebacteria bacterium]|nr:hypothetical protein [Candidatus Paceibacterota bacterium]